MSTSVFEIFVEGAAHLMFFLFLSTTRIVKLHKHNQQKLVSSLYPRIVLLSSNSWRRLIILTVDYSSTIRMEDL